MEHSRRRYEDTIINLERRHNRLIGAPLVPIVLVILVFVISIGISYWPVTADSFLTNQKPSVVIGQKDFVSTLSTYGTYGGTNAFSLELPADVAFDPKGNLWVSDIVNNRVLEYTPPFKNGQAASIVIGQVDFKSVLPNGGTSYSPIAKPSDKVLYSPSRITFDRNGDLWVTDTGNSRILKFDHNPFIIPISPSNNDEMSSIRIDDIDYFPTHLQLRILEYIRSVIKEEVSDFQFVIVTYSHHLMNSAIKGEELFVLNGPSQLKDNNRQEYNQLSKITT